jgi:hypothetical protein
MIETHISHFNNEIEEDKKFAFLTTIAVNLLIVLLNNINLFQIFSQLKNIIVDWSIS